MSIRIHIEPPVSPRRPMIISSRPVDALPAQVSPVLARLSADNLRLACAVIELERELRAAGASDAADEIMGRYGLRRS